MRSPEVSATSDEIQELEVEERSGII